MPDIKCQIGWQKESRTECQSICHKKCHIEYQNTHGINTSDGMSEVRIVCKGGDDAKKAILYVRVPG